jgi:hypothetical protein
MSGTATGGDDRLDGGGGEDDFYFSGDSECA